MPAVCRAVTVVLALVLSAGFGRAQDDAAGALEAARLSGRALGKVIAPNDTGATGSHQSGLYLPKGAWPFFSGRAPVEDENHSEPALVKWPDGSESRAAVRWYGRGGRSEFRLTGLGSAGRRWLAPESAGSLLVLIPDKDGAFTARVLSSEADIAAWQQATGMEPGRTWDIWRRDPAPDGSDPITAWAVRETAGMTDFPSGHRMAELARAATTACHPDIAGKSPDEQLMAWMEAEYAIFRVIEAKMCGAQMRGPFQGVDEFLTAASSMMNRRKARAGHSLEEHTAHLLTTAGIAFDAQASIDGNVRPDILLPGRDAYNDPARAADDLVILGLKTTCRDRWRQVLNEGRRVTVKHLLTLQPAMSKAQLAEMRDARLQLVVPAPLHAGYDLPDGYRLVSVAGFLTEMKRRFPR